MTQPLASLDPDIRLFGNVDDAMFSAFTDQLSQARQKRERDQPLLLELTTSGGAADTARRIATDLRLCREIEGRTLRFLGKSMVYSAGITIMAAFRPQERYLTAGTELLIHERRIERTVALSGALRSVLAVVRDLQAELDSGQRLERAGFEQLVAGSRMTADEVMLRIMQADWYLGAEEALTQGLVGAVV